MSLLPGAGVNQGDTAARSRAKADTYCCVVIAWLQENRQVADMKMELASAGDLPGVAQMPLSLQQKSTLQACVPHLHITFV